MWKLSIPLATIFVEKKIEKNFGVVLDPFEIPHERNFWYLEKNGVLKIFEWVHHPESVIHGSPHHHKNGTLLSIVLEHSECNDKTVPAAI